MKTTPVDDAVVVVRVLNGTADKAMSEVQPFIEARRELRRLNARAKRLRFPGFGKKWHYAMMQLVAI